MEGKGLDQFLEQIGYGYFPDNPDDLSKFYDAVLENLPDGEQYRFLVTAKHPRYVAPRFPMSQRTELIRLRAEFQKEHTKHLRDYFSEHGISFSDIEIGFTFPVDLTREQARDIEKLPFVQNILPDHPRSLSK